jgi:4-carboxymuconolactone decarboxylase
MSFSMLPPGKLAKAVYPDASGFRKLRRRTMRSFKSLSGDADMDTGELYERGLELRKKIFGGSDVEKRMQSMGEFGAPLQHIVNAYVYGDIWSRPELPNKSRSLAMLGITAAINRPQEFRIHVKGALANGCTREEIREVLLLVAMYCGVPASNEAHRIALEVFGEA